MLRKDSKPACNQSTLSHRNQLGYSIAAVLRSFIPARATIQPVSLARKSVIVRKLTRDWCAGYAAANLAAEFNELELLDSSGKLIRIPWSEVKWVCYVRELASGDSATQNSALGSGSPERILRRRFTSRPRIAGVWIRIVLSDGDEIEGVAVNDRSLVDGSGLLLTPPDTRSNTQRVFIPRSSIREFTVLGVIAPSPALRRKASQQPYLFEKEPSELDQSGESIP